MKKKNKFRFLSVWLLLSMLFGISWSAWAASSDVIQSVTVSGSTFTITRSDASAATFVNYRTLDGSAVGGVHFEHQSGRLYFKKGELTKTVVVKTKSFSGMDAFGNADRKFSFVAWNDYSTNHMVDAVIGGMKSYSYSSSTHSISMIDKWFWWNDDYAVWTNIKLGKDRSAQELDYIDATKQQWKGYIYTYFTTEHRDDGWYETWYYYGGTYLWHNEVEYCTTKSYTWPWDWEMEVNYSRDTEFKIHWESHGSGDDYSKVTSLYAKVKILDKTAPSIKSVTCNTQEEYSYGNVVRVALTFDEIVRFQSGITSSNVVLKTNIGDLKYVGGENTSTLYFEGIANSKTDLNYLQVNECNGSVEDLARNGKSLSGINKKIDAFKYKCAYAYNVSSTSDIWAKSIKLTWNTSVDVAGTWNIYRYEVRKGVDENYLKQQKIASNIESTSYTDKDEALLYDTDYEYWIQFVPKEADADRFPLDNHTVYTTKLARNYVLSLKTVPNDSYIELQWDNTPFGDKLSHSFQIYRKTGADSLATPLVSNGISVNDNTTSHYVYQDKDISSGCATYSYYVETSALFLDDSTTTGVKYRSNVESGQLTSSSQVLSVSASKGMYAGTVKLSWTSNQVGTDETNYVVYRKELGTQDAWAKIYNTSGVQTKYSYDDNTALPGKYYKYRVSSSYLCSETGKETEPVSKESDGFCRATGVISGRVTYGTGTAVAGVKVSAIKNSDGDLKQFYALRVNGEKTGIQLPLTEERGNTYFAGKPWAIQMYVNPDDGIATKDGKEVSRSMLLDSKNNFGLYITPVNANQFKVGVAGTVADSMVYEETSIEIPANAYSHLTLSCDGTGKLKVRYVLDKDSLMVISDEKMFDPIGSFEADTCILFGSASNDSDIFRGYLDEIRIFSGDDLSDKDIMSNYNHTLAGTEPKLVLYWPMDEGIVNQESAYDYSKSSGITNDNHGVILKGCENSSLNVPTGDQLSVFGVTDEYGNYTISAIPFAGEGTTYMVTPTYGIHKFSPLYLTRFVSASSLVHSGVDFEDVSAFETTGVVYYHNTNYPVQGANIYVDGTICSKDGELIATDANGEFTISVPIGDHHIQVKKQDHVFVDNGRFPSNSLKEYTFDRVLDDKIVFYDSTFVTLTGRVAGGYPESQKIHGLGQGNATIGKATIQLTAGDMYQLNLDSLRFRTFSCPSDSISSLTTTGKFDNGDDARIITVHTDSATGEFAVSVPPIDLQVKSVKVDNNPNITFKDGEGNYTFESNILLASGDLKDQTDSLEVAPGDTVTFTYRYALDLNYRSTPVLELTSFSTKDGAFGDEYYVYQDEATLAYDTIPLYTVDSLSLTEIDIKYTFGYPMFTQGKTYNHEMYLYEPYVNYDGEDSVLTEIPLTGAELSVSNSLGALSVAIGDGVDEEGNDVKDGDVVESSNSSLVVDSLGKVAYSFMATYPNIVEPYTLGMDINFVYEGETYAWAKNGKFLGLVTGALGTGSNFVTSGPDKVLFVLRDPPGTGSSAYLEKGQTISTSSKITTEYNSEYNGLLTWKLGAEIKTATGFGFAVISEARSIADISGGFEISHDNIHDSENSYSITMLESVSTSDAENYVGEDGDIFMGSATNIIIGGARKVAPVRDAEGNYSIKMIDAVSVGEEFTTEFKYTQNYIENVLIPNLESTRNSYLKTVSVSEYNEDYVNKSGRSIYITTKDDSDEDFGLPGTYLQIKGTASEGVDTIGYFNTQINLWKTQLALNEAAKVTAIETNLKYDEDEYNAAVRKFEEAKLLEVSRYKLFDPFVQHYVKLDSAFWFNKQVGIKYSEYGSNKAMIDNILEGFSISRDEYEHYLSVPSKERNITMFYDTKKYGWKVKNISFDSGTTVEESVQRCGSSTTTDVSTTKGVAVVNVKSGFTIHGVGFEFEVETKQGGSESYEESKSTENCTTVGYTLAEDGDDDALSIDVFQAPDGFGPIFYTRAGQTTCPYEDEKKTRYYEPGKHTLATKTMQIEYPRITAGEGNLKAQKLIDIPSGSAANFTLNLDNLSETSENVWYMMYVVDQSNADGAALTIDGVPFSTSRQVLVNALETTHKNLQIKQSRADIMKYDSIAVVLASNCQYDGTDIWEVIADTVYLSVEFVPSCSPLTLEIDSRTMNSSTGDTLQLVVKDYEKDYLNFSEIRLQYKGERDNDWNLAQKVQVEDLDGARQTITFPMSSNLFNDQTYQFRAQSVCTKGTNSVVTNVSETIEVIKDMARPQVLGNPNPADGILDAGDEISVTYNEDIRSSLLSKSDNFVIEAVLNDAEVDHNVALKMDSTSSFAAATEANIVLANKNFAIDMWVNLASGGTLLSHKTSKENFTVSVGSTGKLTVNVNGTKVTSSDKIPFNKWCFLTLCYTAGEEASTVSSLVAYDDETVKLLVEKEAPSYGGTAAISLGKNIRGAISEMALWGTNRANTVAQSQMHFAKAPSTENLIGYWKFDEGHGKVARDAARSRNMALTDDSWYLNNTNYAATLDGKSSMALDITKSTPLSSDDYMVEMWFRGKSQQNATLWSANSSVALKFDANGMLTLMADSVDTQLSTVNYLDGAWHHVSLNVLRNGTTSAYVDGSLVKQIASSKVPALASSELTIGAQRYSNDGGTTFNYKDYFKGDVDEVRFWIATFNAKAIDQFRYMRLNGDEAGLVAYYPFEETTVDAGISMLEFSAKDMSVNAAGKAKGTAKQASTAPALQAKPNMSKLNYSFVASERTIVINLNENANRLEGTTVNFTVKNVRDENNNYSLPVVWSAYVNRNRLVWSDDAISMEKNSEEETSFEVAIANQGAATESWVISNLPTWLTASKTSGALNAQKSEAITFEVSDATPAGTYEETIYLTGNEGISVPFTLNLKVNAGKPDWSVDPSQFENSMSIIAQVKMNGEYSQDAEDLVAAFVNGNCVGVASPVYYARYDAYFVSLNVYGNQSESGKSVVFKAWDASTGVTYPALTSSQNIKFSANKLYGSMSEPVLLETNAQQEQTLGLKSGWNWVSLNVKPASGDVNEVFGDVASSASVLKGKSAFVASDGSTFTGSLASVGVGSMYKINMDEEATLNVAGSAINASKEKVTIKKGWNWVGFNSTKNMSLNDAFAGLSPENGDMIKSQTDFALYQDYEWVGTLTAMTPGKGYMYKSVSSDTRTFTYPEKTASLKSLVSKEPTKATTYKAVDETTYAGNMTIVARVMNGKTIVKKAEVGVFATDECRGAAAVLDNSLVFLTISGDAAGEKLMIKVIYDGDEYVIEQDLVYAEDAEIGSLDNPYIIQLDPVNDVEEQLASSIHVYPTLVENELNVVAESALVLSYQITDALGRVMVEAAANQQQVTINASGLTLGVYMLILNTTEGQMVQRFTKK